ncbi:L,D-transpeptidase [Sphingomicrobium sp. B8]|uniref:L,D-transpeptidase n=2 Tax=Sphingomicrobium clamense TaxID=2851013 RepID=A0ABS6V502_9SPHN|nr:L,D-transpeptidase [Sphingomicrobium sp. B8]
MELSAETWGEVPPDGPFSGSRDEVTLAAQIMLARVDHSPGVIDGYPGGNTQRALSAFQKAQGLDDDGQLDEDSLKALRKAAGDGPLLQRYAIEASDVDGPYKSVAGSMKAMGEGGHVGYGSASEELAEKFGMSESFLKALNPDASFAAGEEILVVAGINDALPKVAKIEVDGGENELRAYDSSGNLVASFPATVGSDEFPSPSGEMSVAAIAPEANYTFDPSDQEWGGDETLVIAPGPNNPIGGIWIDLGKEGYGIHGSPDPALIGKTSSHGCVRLTNWDARALIEAVSTDTEVIFV